MTGLILCGGEIDSRGLFPITGIGPILHNQAQFDRAVSQRGLVREPLYSR